MVPEYVEQAGVYRNPETKKFMGTAEAESILEQSISAIARD